jgi:hypothetical protein
MLNTSCNLAVSRRRLRASASSVGVACRCCCTRRKAAIRSWGVASRIKRGFNKSHIKLCLRDARRFTCSLDESNGGGNVPSASAGPASAVAVPRETSGRRSIRLRMC